MIGNRSSLTRRLSMHSSQTNWFFVSFWNTISLRRMEGIMKVEVKRIFVP